MIASVLKYSFSTAQTKSNTSRRIRYLSIAFVRNLHLIPIQGQSKSAWQVFVWIGHPHHIFHKSRNEAPAPAPNFVGTKLLHDCDVMNDTLGVTSLVTTISFDDNISEVIFLASTQSCSMIYDWKCFGKELGGWLQSKVKLQCGPHAAVTSNHMASKNGWMGAVGREPGIRASGVQTQPESYAVLMPMWQLDESKI